MRSERFDTLVTALGRRSNRRGFIAGTAGFAVAGIQTGSAGTPDDGGVFCVEERAATDPICPGSPDPAAVAARLIAGLGVAAPGCLAGDAPCRDGAACCSGICTMHRRCGCFESGHLCPSDGFCCGGVCWEGRCRDVAGANLPLQAPQPVGRSPRRNGRSTR